MDWFNNRRISALEREVKKIMSNLEILTADIEQTKQLVSLVDVEVKNAIAEIAKLHDELAQIEVPQSVIDSVEAINASLTAISTAIPENAP